MGWNTGAVVLPMLSFFPLYWFNCFTIHIVFVFHWDHINSWSKYTKLVCA